MIENSTQHKANEADFHLRQAKKHYQEDDEFSYFLSAFLSAARSITFYMQKQYRKHTGFSEWYCTEQTRMIADEDLRYLNEARVEDVHLKPVQTGATRAISCGCDAILVKAGEELSFDANPVMSEKAVNSRNVTLRRYFGGRVNVDVLEFCSSQLKKLNALIARCEAKFPNKTN